MAQIKTSHWDECEHCQQFFWNVYGKATFCSSVCAKQDLTLQRRPPNVTAMRALVAEFLAQPEVPRSDAITRAAYRVFGKEVK